MNLKSIVTGILGGFLSLVGLVLLYLVIAVLPATDCKTVFQNGKLIHHSCTKIYYTIASQRVSGDVIGDVVIVVGALLLVVGIWLLWRTFRSSSGDGSSPD